MEKDARGVAGCVNDCNNCGRGKLIRYQVTSRRLPVPLRKFDVIHIDIFGERSLKEVQGKKMILTVVDRLSGWVQLFPIGSKRTEVLKRILFEEWFCKCGFPAGN